MNFIETKNELINITNTNFILKLENPTAILFMFSDNNESAVYYRTEEERDTEYNRIKSILIGEED